MSLDETSPLVPSARDLVRSHHASPPIQTIPEEAGVTHRFGPRLVARLVVDSIPGMFFLLTYLSRYTDNK